MPEIKFQIWKVVRHTVIISVTLLMIAAAFYFLVPAASAGIGDCPHIPCDIGPLPTLPEPGDLNVTFDIENSTYLRYWFNYSTPLDFPWAGVIYSLTLPFTMQIGAWFFAIIWFLYLGMLYNRQQDPIGVFVIGILSAAIFGAFFPPETYLVAILIFAVSAVGILMRIMKEKR